MSQSQTSNTGNYLILFADLIGSTEVATEALPSAFTELYIASFQWAARRAYEFVQKQGLFEGQDFSKPLAMPRIQGDEALSFTKLDEFTEEEKQDCVASAVAFAYVVKVMWLACPYNVQRLRDKQFQEAYPLGCTSGQRVQSSFRGAKPRKLPGCTSILPSASRVRQKKELNRASLHPLT